MLNIIYKWKQNTYLIWNFKITCFTIDYFFNTFYIKESEQLGYYSSGTLSMPLRVASDNIETKMELMYSRRSNYWESEGNHSWELVLRDEILNIASQKGRLIGLITFLLNVLIWICFPPNLQVILQLRPRSTLNKKSNIHFLYYAYKK